MITEFVFAERCTVGKLKAALECYDDTTPVVAYDDRLYNFVSRLWIHEHVDVAMGGVWIDDQTVLVIE